MERYSTSHTVPSFRARTVGWFVTARKESNDIRLWRRFYLCRATSEIVSAIFGAWITRIRDAYRCKDFNKPRIYSMCIGGEDNDEPLAQSQKTAET
jgi:hypothetical protein